MQAHQSSVDYYAVLGVARDASTKEINIAFKKLALKLHPDKCGGDERSIEYFRKVRRCCDPSISTYIELTIPSYRHKKQSRPFVILNSAASMMRHWDIILIENSLNRLRSEQVATKSSDTQKSFGKIGSGNSGKVNT